MLRPLSVDDESGHQRVGWRGLVGRWRWMLRWAGGRLKRFDGGRSPPSPRGCEEGTERRERVDGKMHHKNGTVIGVTRGEPGPEPVFHSFAALPVGSSTVWRGGHQEEHRRDAAAPQEGGGNAECREGDMFHFNWWLIEVGWCHFTSDSMAMRWECFLASCGRMIGWLNLN